MTIEFDRWPVIKRNCEPGVVFHGLEVRFSAYNLGSRVSCGMMWLMSTTSRASVARQKTLSGRCEERVLHTAVTAGKATFLVAMKVPRPVDSSNL